MYQKATKLNGMAKILNVSKLKKSYSSGSGSLTVLDDISFSVEEGETFSIVGPSGSGKTTLLGLSAGLDRPDSGTIELCGVEISTLNEDERALLRNRKIGFIFQDFQLLPTLTAQENVAVPLELQGAKNAAEKAATLLEKVGLANRFHHYPSQLSGGEQQRVALARAFSNTPAILFADEPTGELDEATGQKIIQLLFDLNKEAGTTLIIITHDMELARKTQRILRLKGGKISAGSRDPYQMNHSKAYIKRAGLGWLFKMAWRDLRSNVGKLFLFMSSIIIGIAAVVAIQSFGNNLTDSIAFQSKALMGADYIIDSSKPANEKVAAIIDSLGGANSREINFASMVAFPKKDVSKLVQVLGVEGGFPFYGDFETTPVSAAREYQNNNSALVDATVMLQYNLKPGDSIKVGTITLPIAGSLTSVPGRSALSSSVAPAVYIPYGQIEATGLLQKGSRVEYKYYFVATQGQDLDALYEAIDQRLDAEGADMDTHMDESRRLGRRYNNFGKFLNIVAFIALLLGCIGIASAVHVYIRGKLRSIAVLKCMGASRSQTFKIFLLQIAGIGGLGGLIGTLLGVALQLAAPSLLQEYLPVDVAVTISYPAIFLGLSLGILMSVAFALLPLLETWYVSPLSVLRVQEEIDQRTGKARILVLGLIFLFLFVFALRILDNWRYALFFILGLLVTFALLLWCC